MKSKAASSASPRENDLPRAGDLPRPGERKRGVDGYLGYLLRQANAASSHALQQALADLGLTAPQFLVLTLVKAYPGQPAAQIARLALLTPQTLTVIVRNLERDGALTRTAPAAGRAISLNVTPAGEALLVQCRARTAPLEARMAAGLSPEEESVVRRWLVRVATDFAGDGDIAPVA